MKTKLLVLTLIATISMVVCPSVYSDNPPKKDKDLSTNGVSVGNAPLENFLHGDNLFNLESGFYYVFVWGETNQLLDCSLPTSIRPSLFRKTPGIGLRFKLFLLPTH